MEPIPPNPSKFLQFWKSLLTWRSARRTLIAVALSATLLAAFYAEENWRGKRAWEKCKRELEAKGEGLNWDTLIPPPVPDADPLRRRNTFP